MPKRLSQSERRARIIEATLACLARDGAHGTSLRSVSRELGVAPSLVTHFFGTWHDVLIASYAHLTERFMAQLSPLLMAGFASERARMDAFILRYLSTDWAGENTIGANIALWQLGRGVIDLNPHFSRFLRTRTRLLRLALGAFAAEAGVVLDVGDVTACFILMLDGMWLELSTNPGGITQKRAMRLCWVWLDAVVRK